MQHSDARDPQQNRPAESTDGGMGGMHEGPQRLNDGSPDTSAADGDVGRVGESPRQGQGGYGNDTGFTGGTVGATDGMSAGAAGDSADGMRRDAEDDDADLGTEMAEADDAGRRAGGQSMDGARDRSEGGMR